MPLPPRLSTPYTQQVTADHPAGLRRDAHGGVHLQLEIDVGLFANRNETRDDLHFAGGDGGAKWPHQCTYLLEAPERIRGL